MNNFARTILQLSQHLIVLFTSTAISFAADTAPTEPIMLGGIFSLSGFGAEAGMGELRATKLAVEEINRTGGVRGRKLEIRYEDNQSGLKETATVFKKLVSDPNINVILGPNWVEFTEVAAYLAEKQNVVLLSASGYKKKAIADNRFVFTTWPKHSAASKPLSDYLQMKQHTRIAAVITENAYYNSAFDEMYQQLNLLGVTVDEIHHFSPGVRDYRSIISKMKRSKVDAVLVFLLEDGETSSFLKQKRQLRFAAQTYGTVGLQFDTEVSKRPEIADGAIFFDIAPRGISTFSQRYMEKFGEKPISSSALAYDNVFVIKEAMERCGLTSEDVRRCLQTGKFKGVTGEIAFDADGNTQHTENVSRLMTIQDGSYIELKPN